MTQGPDIHIFALAVVATDLGAMRGFDYFCLIQIQTKEIDNER
jgi:hypothetical protein